MIRNYIDLSSEELCALYQKGDETAYEYLVIKNMGYLRNAAKYILYEFRDGYYSDSKFICNEYSVDEMIQMARIGLMRAALRYQPDKGAKFLTYAKHYIFREMYRAKIQSESIVIPENKFWHVMKLRQCMNRYPDATEKELYNHMKEYFINLRPKTFQELLELNQLISSVTSLNRTVFDDEEALNFIEDKSVTERREKEESEKEKFSYLRQIFNVLDCLSQRDKEIVIKRNGLDGKGVFSEEELSQMYNISVSHVHAIEKKATLKLKALLARA